MEKVLGIFRRKFITVEAARAEAGLDPNKVELTAILTNDATIGRPKWILEFRNSKNEVYVIGSRSRTSRPFYANAPSGIYGVGVELGVSQVVMKLPTERHSEAITS